MNRIDQVPEAGISSFFPELTRSLERGLNDIEPKFETLGQNLQRVYAESEALSKGIMTSVNSMTDGSEDGLMHHVGTVVSNSLSSLRRCRETISGSLERITAGAGHLSRLCSICEEMRKKSAFLNIVGLNIGVEGSRSNEALAMFGDFGHEIKALAGSIDQISKKIYGDSRTVQADQQTVYTDISGSMNTFDDLSESTKHAVQHATQEMERIGQLASQTLEKAGRHSQEISRIVGEIVMSIQFHDIARQQVEHIVSALNDAVSLLDAETADPEETDRNKGRIYSILALQAGQLKLVATDGREVYEKIQAAFGRIGHEVEQLMENISAAGSQKGPELEQDVQGFQAELEKLKTLLDEGNALEEKIQKTMDRSSRAVSTLSQYTDQVKNININLQYKAINAIIMTSKLGEKGATLEVLARHVRDLSNESNAMVKNVIGIITSITELSEGRDAEAGTRTEAVQDIASSMGIDIAQGINRISEAFDRYRQNRSGAGDKSASIMETIEQIHQDLDFFPEWLQGCTQTLEALEDQLGALDHWKDLAGDGEADTVDDIASRYTMESERRVHEQLTGQTGDEAGESSGATGKSIPPADGEDELDDNIELF